MLLFTLPPQVRLDALLPVLCSCVAQHLNVPPTGKELVSASLGRAGETVRLGVSLAAAAHGKGRVLARLGRVGES